MRFAASSLSPVLAVFLWTAEATGQDACRDILADGVFDQRQFENTTYNRLVDLTILATQDETEIAKRTGAAAKFKDSSSLLRGDFTSHRIKTVRQALQSVGFRSVEGREYLSNFVHEASPVVAQAWTGCMAQRGGGLQVWFTTQSSTRAILNVRYVPQLAPSAMLVTNATAAADLSDTTGVTIYDNGDCLKIRKVFNAGMCTVTVDLPYTKDLSVTIHTASGDYSAYLPPRVDYRLVTREYPTNLLGRFRWTETTTSENAVLFRKVLPIDPAVADSGWVFDSKETAPVAPTSRSSSGLCGFPSIDSIRSRDIFVSYNLSSHQRRGSAICEYSITPRIMRIEKVERK